MLVDWHASLQYESRWLAQDMAVPAPLTPKANPLTRDGESDLESFISVGHPRSTGYWFGCTALRDIQVHAFVSTAFSSGGLWNAESRSYLLYI